AMPVDCRRYRIHAGRGGRAADRVRLSYGRGSTDSLPDRRRSAMGLAAWIKGWPVYRQLTGADPLGRGAAVRSSRTDGLAARIENADTVARSVCPYCAVGCGQRVYVKDGQVIQIEGDPDSPISRGRLCPKGSASRQLHEHPAREYKVKYRPPHATEWEELDLDTAMDMIADRLIAARDAGWEEA